MGNFSRDTFNELKHFVAVRLQQGVPIVDADVNERDDIRARELRNFLRLFVGDGVAEGNDGFRIAPPSPAADNAFRITGGDGTARGAGRCLVDGQDVMIESTIAYTAQQLFGNAALVTRWGVTPLGALTTPASARSDVVYLDVWEREVNYLEDASLVDSRINVETCVRRKREWVVRVAEGASVPPAPPAGHAHYALARLQRHAGVGLIAAPDIADLRRTGIRMISEIDMRSFLTDAFGPAYPSRPTAPQLPVSLREAINELIWGRIPLSDERVVPETLVGSYGFDSRDMAAIRDATRADGSVWLFWVDPNAGGGSKIKYSRVNSDLVWDIPQRLTTDNTASERMPQLAVVGNELMVFWTTTKSGARQLYCKTLSSSGAWKDERFLGQSIEYHTNSYVGYLCRDVSVYLDSLGYLWVLWVDEARKIKLVRRAPDGAWNAPEVVSTYTSPIPNPSGGDVWHSSPGAVEVSPGRVVLFWQTWVTGASTYQEPKVWIRTLNLSYGGWSASASSKLESYYATGEDEVEPFAVRAGADGAWIFWVSYRYLQAYGGKDGYHLYAKQISPGGGAYYDQIRLTEDPASGGSALLVEKSLPGSRDVLLMLRDDQKVRLNMYAPDTLWSKERVLANQYTIGGIVSCLDGKGGAFVFWHKRTQTGYSSFSTDIRFRRMIVRL